MLTRLRVRNFKAWKDTGNIRLAPLTVFFGTNSAGKSSIGQLLLLLKQTSESPDRQRVLQLGDSRTLIDLGTFADVLHNHDVSRSLDVSLEWSPAEPMEVVDPLSDSRVSGNSLAFDVTIHADKRGQPAVTAFRHRLRQEEVGKDIGTDVGKDAGKDLLSVGMERRPRDNRFDLVAKDYTLVRQQGRAWPLPDPLRCYGFPDEATAYFQNTAFLSDFVLELERLLKGIYYVGPLREFPKRLYLWSGEVPEHVGARGERVIEAILGGSERSFNFRPRQRHVPFQELLARRLKSMGLIHDFVVKPLAPHRKEYEVLVRTGPRRPEVKLTDVGFGVSQVLPVLVECFYVPRRSIVVFEQPELHLHPKVQSDLADLFIDAIRAREDNAPRDCQFIIESHSEHFLRRLQRRIAEEKLSKDEAALYFVEGGGGAARINELQVDAFGNIRNWPDDFFGDEMEDLVARTEAQARRMEKGDGA